MKNLTKAQLLMKLREKVKKGNLSTLRVEDIPSLKGKRIQTIYFGYSGQDGVDDFVVGEMMSEYDIAKNDRDMEGWNNRAEYWESYMDHTQLSDMKNKYSLLTAEGRNTFIRTDNFSNGMFWCSDDDRFVLYRIVK